MARHIPLGEEVHLAPQERFVVRRQLVRPRGELPANERSCRVAHQRVGIFRPQLGEVSARAEIRKQQEAGAEIGDVHLWCMHARLREQLGDMHERPAVLLFGRRVHDHEAAAIGERGAEVAAETRILRSGREAEALAAERVVEPLLQPSATIVDVYHAKILTSD